MSVVVSIRLHENGFHLRTSILDGGIGLRNFLALFEEWGFVRRGDFEKISS